MQISWSFPLFLEYKVWASVVFSTPVICPPWAFCPSSLLRIISTVRLSFGVKSHMTLHWSPAPAAGADMAGDPLLPPISPSRLRPWKAPKKESFFAGAGFLAAVVCCTWKRGWWLLNMFTDEHKIFAVTVILLLTYPWEAVVAPEVSFSDRPLCVLLGQDGLLSFPLANTTDVTLGTWQSSLFMWGADLSSLSQVCLAKSLSWTTGQVTEYFITLSEKHEHN